MAELCVVVSWKVVPLTLVPQSKIALCLVELYYLNCPNLLFNPFKYNLKWLSYVQCLLGNLSLGE